VHLGGGVKIRLPNAGIIEVKKPEFEKVAPLWDGYLTGKVLRKELRSRTYYSKYIISIFYHLG